MALERFNAPILPNPPSNLSPEVQDYCRQLIRVLGVYFNYLDSQTPNMAQSYRATVAFYLKDSADVYWKVTVGTDGTLLINDTTGIATDVDARRYALLVG